MVVVDGGPCAATKKGRRRHDDEDAVCGTTSSPVWYHGINGPRTLCKGCYEAAGRVNNKKRARPAESEDTVSGGDMICEALSVWGSRCALTFIQPPLPSPVPTASVP